MNKLNNFELGKLTFLEFTDVSKFKYKKATYRCFCGKEFVTTVASVNNKHTRSCGCYRKAKRTADNITHGESYTKLYKSWKGMKNRCNNPNATHYEYYGGKGIKVCKKWSNDFLTFKQWALNNEYNEKLSLDRINSKNNYSPKNCRWVNSKTQAVNQKDRKKSTNMPQGVSEIKGPKGTKYKVQICINYKIMQLGRFDSIKEASKIYQNAKKERDFKYLTNQL